MTVALPTPCPLPVGEVRSREAPPGWDVVALDGVEALADHQPAWEALAANSLEPNPFHEPWMLLPATRTLADGALRFVLVYGPDPEVPPAGRVLYGLFPLERRSHYRGLPLPHHALWAHRHCFLGTPLLRRHAARPALEGLFGWLRGQRAGGLLDMPLLSGDGPFNDALSGFLTQGGRPSFEGETYCRPVLRPHGDGEAYLGATLSGHARKLLRQKERGLCGLGLLSDAHFDGRSGEEWIESFLSLEASGWKGSEGTALGRSPADRAFFRAATRGAAERGRLVMNALRLDGRTIAQDCIFRAGDGGFAFKIAYDERYGRFSPGLLLEVHKIRHLHERPEVAWLDSCTTPEPSPFVKLWSGRRRVRDLLVSTGGVAADAVVRSLPLARALGRGAHRLARWLGVGQRGVPVSAP